MIKKFVWDLRNEFHGYNGKTFSKDVMAGLTVAAVALPLALAFGVSSGATAASGLITAIVAGVIIGTLSGASYQISGPTGAMSAILLTLSAKYGIKGVLTAGFLSGILLILAALFKIGKLVSYIPSPVITGFTSGIAVIIVLGQVDNFFGTHSKGESAVFKLISYAKLGFHPNLWAILFGVVVVLIMLFYPKKFAAFVPSSLAGIVIALLLNILLNPDASHSTVTEVGAIPKSLMTNNSILLNGFDLKNITTLIFPAISIATLGMIESLLCGACAGKMKHEKLDADRELLSQGIGNLLIPLLGGVPATAAIARTSVAIKSGGVTRLVSVFHSVTLILSMFLLGGVMSRIPLSALAGVLAVTAWRMNEWNSIKQIFSKHMKASIIQFSVTMFATIVFDLTVAILAGVIAAMLIFVIKSSELKVIVSNIDMKKLGEKGLHGNHEATRLVYLSGPLFFGTQEKLLNTYRELEDTAEVIFSMRGVPSIAECAVDELFILHDLLQEEGVLMLLCGVQPHVKEMLDKSGFTEKFGEENFFWDAISAIKYLEKLEKQTVSKAAALA